MTNSLQSALINFKKAAYDLQDQWTASGDTFILCDNYPFSKDFAEVVSDISYWAETGVENISKLHISSSIIENTGGGVYVSYSTIENDDKLKMIGVSRECIVGYNKPYIEATGEEDTLWIVDIGDWSNLPAARKQLNEIVPTIADELITTLIMNFGYEYLKEYDGEEELFVSEHVMAVTDAFMDDTGRFDVDPIEHYGLDKIVEAMSKLPNE